ncbi:MAG TPA: hypothetical protein VIF57_16035 [Polyangia bacterium]|jgi:hypothetical protein
MTLDELVGLMDAFVRGDAISLRDANRLESALLEFVPEHPELDELADDLAAYEPYGGEGLFTPTGGHAVGAYLTERQRFDEGP